MSFTEKEIEAAAEGVHGHQILAFDGMQVVCECDETWQDAAEYPAHLSRAVLAAVAESRTVTDVAGLDALPIGTIGVDKDGVGFCVDHYGACSVGYDPCVAPSPTLPAQVLHYGEGAGK